MSRLEKLKNLENEIYALMQKANSRAYPALARQYRETLREIDELEGEDAEEDAIAELIASREGKPTAH